jgi:uncharacterized Zn finger protein (UPF0148 family)
MSVDFIFCPWCGAKRGVQRAQQIDARIDEPKAEFERFSREEQQKRIIHMARILDDLEKDLSALALSEEMHK